MPLTIYHGREMSTISGNAFKIFLFRHDPLQFAVQTNKRKQQNVDVDGKVVSKYVKQGTNKEKLWEHGSPLGDPLVKSSPGIDSEAYWVKGDCLHYFTNNALSLSHLHYLLRLTAYRDNFYERRYHKITNTVLFPQTTTRIDELLKIWCT